MKTNLLLALVFSFFLLSCEKNVKNMYDPSDKLIGYWVHLVAIDTVITTFERANELSDEYGFAFKKQNVFVERKNAGWCGTPPVSYADYEGTWIQEDSIVTIHVGFWGGTAEYQWRIVNVDEDQLTIYRIKEEYFLEQ